MLNVITNYWVVWLCGLIAGGLGFMMRRWIKLENQNFLEIRKRETEEVKKEIIDKLENEIALEVKKANDADEEIRQEMKKLDQTLDNVTSGVLAIHGQDFRQQCRELLEPGHVITIDEYEQCVEDHDVYKLLGGNHRGDTLFDSVVQKWSAQLIK